MQDRVGSTVTEHRAPGAELRRLVADACRILASEGQDHFYLGHVSAREPGSSLICMKPSGIGLGEARADDLVVLDLDGRRIEGDRPIHHEVPIHVEIYRVRPDVNCVVHTHPFYAAAFAASHASFQMVSQDSVLFADGFGYYPHAELVVTPQQGRELAQRLDRHKLAVLKNHGIAVAASSVQDATFLAVSFDRSLRVQLAASQLGGVNPISPDEVAAMNAYFDRSYQGRVQVTWEYLLRKVPGGR